MLLAYDSVLGDVGRWLAYTVILAAYVMYKSVKCYNSSRDCEAYIVYQGFPMFKLYNSNKSVTLHKLVKLNNKVCKLKQQCYESSRKALKRVSVIRSVNSVTPLELVELFTCLHNIRSEDHNVC